ncbi:hypothetical protein Emag_005120 [Eimeria magna]
MRNQGASRERCSSLWVHCVQHEEAGDILLARGQVESAAEHYLLGKVPAKAADLITKSLPPAKLLNELPLEEAGERDNAEASGKARGKTSGLFSSDFIASVADALLEIELPARAADLLAHVEDGIAHLVKAGRGAEAVKVCMEARLWKQALHLLKDRKDAEALRTLLSVAEHLEQQGDLSEAEDAYVQAQALDRAVKMRFDPSLWELCLLKTCSPGDRDTICMRLAARLSVEGNVADAERLFLAAGEWAAAERVALSSGGQEARRRVWLRRAQQLLKSEGPEAAVQLLIEVAAKVWLHVRLQHGESAAAAKLAVESSAFELALVVAKAHCPEEIKDIYLQLARQKEAAGETAAAEEAYLQAGAPAAAIAVYKKRGQWEEALRLAREHRPSEVQSLLMQQAKAKVAAEDLEGAQGVLLEAGRSDLAVQLLVRKGKWAAAIRLAGEKARPMLAEVLQQQQQQQSSVKTLHELKDLCEALEGVGAIQRAVDLCLATDDVQTGDPSELRRYWLHAVDLAQRADDPFLRERAAATAAKKLQLAGDLASAGQVLLSAGRGHEALQCYVSAQDWKSASALAISLGPAAEAELARHRRMQLKTTGDVEGLLHAGEVDIALGLLAEANEWSRCLKIAAERRHPMLAQLLKRRFDALLEANSPAEAAEALGTYGALQAETVWPLCERVASALDAQHLQQQISKQSASQGKEEDKLSLEDSSSDCSPFRITRQMYIRLLTGKESATVPPLNALPWFSSWKALEANAAEQRLLQAHFECIAAECASISGLEQLSAKAALSVLRYSASSPCIDWLYYRWASTAQWILNRCLGRSLLDFSVLMYLDLCEFIDDPSQTEIDLQPFRDFGLPLPDLKCLPKAHSAICAARAGQRSGLVVERGRLS